MISHKKVRHCCRTKLFRYLAIRGYVHWNGRFETAFLLWMLFVSPPAREQHINELCLLSAGENRYTVQRQDLASQVY